ncbi:hypothetical protein BC835DRAFT_1307226 [Cytidiella melzeri]|nr:hypothetical protein BC835DRAFT_1307226 [Cytidiella melzeri]
MHVLHRLFILILSVCTVIFLWLLRLGPFEIHLIILNHKHCALAHLYHILLVYEGLRLARRPGLFALAEREERTSWVPILQRTHCFRELGKAAKEAGAQCHAPLSTLQRTRRRTPSATSSNPSRPSPLASTTARARRAFYGVHSLSRTTQGVELAFEPGGLSSCYYGWLISLNTSFNKKNTVHFWSRGPVISGGKLRPSNVHGSLVELSAATVQASGETDIYSAGKWTLLCGSATDRLKNKSCPVECEGTRYRPAKHLGEQLLPAAMPACLNYVWNLEENDIVVQYVQLIASCVTKVAQALTHLVTPGKRRYHDMSDSAGSDFVRRPNYMPQKKASCAGTVIDLRIVVTSGRHLRLGPPHPTHEGAIQGGLEQYR